MSDSDFSSMDTNDSDVTPPREYPEGIHCCCCLAHNISGRRYKCLICYNYVMCRNCYDAKIVVSPHQLQHPVQYIFTLPDSVILFCGGDPTDNPLRSQLYICPYCGILGFTKDTLYAHVSSEHPFPAFEGFGMVICPICATTPGADANYFTANLAGHLCRDHDCDDTGDNVLCSNELENGSEAAAGPSSGTAPEAVPVATSGPSTGTIPEQDSDMNTGRVHTVRLSLDSSSSDNSDSSSSVNSDNE